MSMIRELPEGYTDQHDSNAWNVGEVFRWSDVWEDWLDCKVRLTIEPNMSVSDAFEARMDHPLGDHPLGDYYAVFFNRAFV